MSNQNNESTGSGRNPIIIIGGGLLLVGAVIVLIFGGTFFGDNDNVSDGAVADSDIVRDDAFAGNDIVRDDAVVSDAAVRERLAQAENTAPTNIKLPDSGPPLQVGRTNEHQAARQRAATSSWRPAI